MSRGAPLLPYIKEQGGGGGRPGRRRAMGSPTPTGSRTPPLPCWSRRGEGRRERGKGKGGAAPPLLVQFGPGGRRRVAHLWLPLSLSTKAHMAHYFSRGGSGNPPVLRFSPKSPGTLPVSEYSRPIYQSSCLDHFETPRHVRDHIRDSGLPSVHQNT